VASFVFNPATGKMIQLDSAHTMQRCSAGRVGLVCLCGKEARGCYLLNARYKYYGSARNLHT
jgi:hypothetical protein